MTERRQPLMARVWGSQYRTWFWGPDSPRQNRKGKRRSAKRERQKAAAEIRQVRVQGEIMKVYHAGGDGTRREVNGNGVDYGDGTVMIEYADTGEIAIVPRAELSAGEGRPA